MRLKLILLCPVMLGTCGCSDLQEPVNQNILSQAIPGTDQKAVLFMRDAGATTAESFQVSVLAKATELPNEAGNVFICDQEVKVTVETNKVVIIYPRTAHVFLRNDHFGSLQIEYNNP